MLNAFAKRIYDFNVTMGWHAGQPDLAKYLMNLHEEVSELWSAWRTGKVTFAPCSPRVSGPNTDCDTHNQPMGFDGTCGAGQRAAINDLCDKADKMRAMGEHPLTCIEEELADILIRTLDTARAFGVDIDRAVEVKLA